MLRTRIVFVDRRAILREGLRALIDAEPDFEIAGDFGAAAEGLAGIRRLQPDVVLTDLAVPGSWGCELLAEIKRAAPHARTLVLTERSSEEDIRDAIIAGVNGYMLKDANRAELVLAIRTVSSGRRFICQGTANKILSGYLSGGKPRRRGKAPRRITVRERQVLARIAVGDSNKTIARDMRLSVKTIEKHRSNMMRKLNLHNAAAVTLFAVRAGLADDPKFVARLQSDPPVKIPVD